MSAPRTNIETQKRRHYGPLIGTAVVVIFAAVLLVWWLTEEFSTSNPQDATVDQAPVSERPVETIESAPGVTPSQNEPVPETSIAP